MTGSALSALDVDSRPKYKKGEGSGEMVRFHRAGSDPGVEAFSDFLIFEIFHLPPEVFKTTKILMDSERILALRVVLTTHAGPPQSHSQNHPF